MTSRTEGLLRAEFFRGVARSNAHGVGFDVFPAGLGQVQLVVDHGGEDERAQARITS